MRSIVRSIARSLMRSLLRSLVRSIVRSIVRSTVKPIEKKIDQEPWNLGTSPPSEIGPETGTGNQGTQNREPGNPACDQNRRDTFAKSFNFREDPFSASTISGK